MKASIILTAVVGLTVATAPVAFARGPGGSLGSGHGASSFSPGQQFRTNGAMAGYPGASGYAPGHQYRLNGAVSGYHGASGYAPGHKFKRK